MIPYNKFVKSINDLEKVDEDLCKIFYNMYKNLVKRNLIPDYTILGLLQYMSIQDNITYHYDKENLIKIYMTNPDAIDILFTDEHFTNMHSYKTYASKMMNKYGNSTLFVCKIIYVISNLMSTLLYKYNLQY